MPGFAEALAWPELPLAVRYHSIVTDRSHWPVRKLRLGEEDDRADYSHYTPSERVAMVWELTKNAWALPISRYMSVYSAR